MIIFDILRPTLDDTTSPDEQAPGGGHRWLGAERLHGPHSTASADVAARDVLRRYRDYRMAFAQAAITCTAEALRQPEVATAVRKRGQPVDVHSCEELAFVMSAGIASPQIVMHDDGATAAPIRRAVHAGVGRVVLGCCRQVAVVAACGRQCPPILVDVSTDCAGDAIAAVLDRPRLDLVGLHARLTPDADRTAYADKVAQMIAQMAHLRSEHGIILTRISMVGGEVLSDRGATGGGLHALAAALEDAFDDACVRYRFPRPALILAPR